jgi:Arc/MetJ family transcription regulator
MRAPAAAPAAVGIAPPKLIDITDDMSPEDIRKARIANSKAKSAYNKALKAAGVAPGSVEEGEVVVPVPAGNGEAAAVSAPVAARPVATGIPEPDYIEITDDMAPDAVRQARIQNSKLRSAYNKALKAAGIDPASLEEGTAISAPVAPPLVAAGESEPVSVASPSQSGTAGVAAGIPRPDYIEITDDMSPDEIRQARIQNSKLRSAYNKALKAAGIDPSTVE